MILGFLDASMTPQTNIIYLWRHQDTSTSPRKIQNKIEHVFGSLKNRKSEIVNILEKTGADKS